MGRLLFYIFCYEQKTVYIHFKSTSSHEVLFCYRGARKHAIVTIGKALFFMEE
jgi:hypothetical protein